MSAREPVSPDPTGARAVDALLARYPVEPPPLASAAAAVLIVLRLGPSEVETLLIERTVRPDDRASGQIALPGGRVGAEDRSLADTAIRECREEVGLGREDFAGPPRFVGVEHARVFGMDVAVFAAALGPSPRPATPASPSEVASAFWLPRSALGHSEAVMRPSSRGPIEVPAVVYRGHVLWGFTRRLLLRFFGAPLDPSEGGGRPV